MRRTHVAVALLMMACACCSSGPACAQESLRERSSLLAEPGSLLGSLRLVEALERERNFPPAISLLGELLEQYPGNPILLVKRGNLRLAAGHLLAAKADFETVLGGGGTCRDALYGLIKVHEGLRDWERALVLCKGVLESDRGNAFAILHAGWATFQLKRFDEALAWYSRPEHARRREMCLGRGWTLLRLNDLPGARKAFDEVIVRDASDADALEGIRIVERARLTGVLGEVASLEPPQTIEVLSQLREQGRILEALQLSDSLLAREPANRGVLYERALLFSAIGRWQEAEECYSLLLKSEARIEHQRGRMAVLFSLGRLREAALDAAEVLKSLPKEPLALKIVADDLYALGKFEQALDYYKRLPEDLWAWQGAGWCHLLLGNRQEARKAFQELLIRYPGNAAALDGLKRLGD